MRDRHLISDLTSEIDNNFTTHVKSKITFIFQPTIIPYVRESTEWIITPNVAVI